MRPTVSLALFLAMALMSLRLWELLGLAGPLLVMLAVQTLAMMAFASFVTFRAMGRRYDAAIIAGGATRAGDRWTWGGRTGVYHVTGRGDATWYEVARRVFEAVAPEDC